MPHIEIRHRIISKSFNVQALAQDLHETLAREDGITEAQIKTSATPLDHAVVGEKGTNPDGNMIHLTLKIWDKVERTNDVVKPWLEHLVDAAEKYVPSDMPCSVTCELVRIDSDIYISRTYE